MTTTRELKRWVLARKPRTCMKRFIPPTAVVFKKFHIQLRLIHMKKFIAAALILFTFSAVTFAQEHAHSDVEFEYADGAIEIEPGEEGFIFEGEFGEDAFANFASEPGIASELEEGAGINSGDIIGFNVLENLFYWDGSQVASPGAATISIAGVGGSPDAVVSGSSGLLPVDFTAPLNLLGQAGADGDFHVDPGFTISDGAPAGGYGLILSLSTDEAGIADSQPFGIFLNFGLEEEMFEAGVESFATSVPEPSSLMLVVFGVAGLGVLRRKR